MVSSNLVLNSSLLIVSNNFALFPKQSPLDTSLITVNKISCKYFHIVSLVFSVISFVFHNTEKSISGKK